MKKITILLILITFGQELYSQKLLTSWSQQDIENYTKEMYDNAQKLTTTELLTKNINDDSWSSVFLTLNASVNNYKENKDYLIELAKQITNVEETKLEGTSRLIIWDRIITGDITFEGKGLVLSNDLYKVGGRANQLLQNLTNKNFGYVNINSTKEELTELQENWLKHLSDKVVKEFSPIEYPNAKIAEVSSLNAVQALITSLQNNSKKDIITKNCLKNVYKLDEMPKEKGSSASYCNPDTYTYGYLGMLFGDEKIEENKDSKWWLDFWTENHEKLRWNSDLGIYEVGK
jgi:hypothetical protein